MVFEVFLRRSFILSGMWPSVRYVIVAWAMDQQAAGAGYIAPEPFPGFPL
jgi:hypothetical protein